MKIATLHWSVVRAEGYVRLTPEFHAANWVEQMDALQDCIFELQRIYNDNLSTPINEAFPSGIGSEETH